MVERTVVGRGNDVIDLLPPIPTKLPALLVVLLYTHRVCREGN